MRKVVVYELLSLDGVAENPDAFFGWDDLLDANLEAVIKTQDTVVLGRRSFEEWAAYWPTSDIEPFASFINPVRKYIATSTPLDREWTGASAIEGDLVEFVKELKQQDGGDIGVHASITVAQALFAADVVDEIKVVIAPSVAGTGRRFLDGVPAVKLEAADAALSPTGHLIINYRVIR